jgi:hypothetical protein
VTVRGLAESQRWLQRAILAVDGSRSAEAAGETLAGCTRLSAEQRLNIYRRGYRLRLLEVMRGLHPGLRALLGPELFDDFALGYLDACPPRSYTLSELDRRFAGYLSACRPDRNQQPARREAWIDIIVDLVRYERAFAEVYDGPGTEHLPAVRSDSPAWGPDDPTRTVIFAPCIRALAFCAPVHTYFAAVRDGLRPSPPGIHPIWLALSRRDYVVTTTELTPAAHRFLSALIAGASVRVAAGEAELDPGVAADLLHGWAATGWVLPANAVYAEETSCPLPRHGRSRRPRYS